MPAQGSNHDGPLSIKGGGLRLFDPLRVTSKFSEERYGRISLSAAQLNQMGSLGSSGSNALTFQLVPAPGANKFIELMTVNMYYIFGGVAFSTAGSIRVGTAANTMCTLGTVGVFDQTSSQLRTLTLPTANFTPEVNQPLLFLTTGSPSGFNSGNGSALILFSYRIQDLSL